MRDPYLYESVPVLVNKLNIQEQRLLDEAEADYVVFRLKDLTMNPLKGDYHTEHFLKFHQFIFQDLYDWAGVPRKIAIYKEEDVLGGQSVEYSDPFDIVKDLHFVLQDMRSKPWLDMVCEDRAKEFTASLAALWKIHPFREGNTRITITFCCQFMEETGCPINRKLFEDNAGYVRTALVAYNAFFSDGTDFSKKEYLERIVFDSFREEK